MSESTKNESESSSTTTAVPSGTPTVVPVGPGSNQSSAPSAPSSVVEAMQSPMGPTQIPTQFVFQQQIMASPQQQQQQQLMASPQQQQQQQQGNTPGPSPGGSQTQPNGGGNNPSPMNGGMNAAMTMNPSAMSTINMSAMNSMMPSLANNGMAGMTMASMNAAGFQQSMGHPVMSSGGMPQVQVIQQQLPYLQQLYSNAQGQQFLMPGNISLQPTGVNQTIQVIAAGKPFQPGQLTPHLQITGNNMIKSHQNDNNAILQFFNNARNNGCIPTSNNQTLVIGPLITNTQAGNYTQQGQQTKPNDMNKQNQQQQQQQQQPYFQVVNGMPPKSPVMASTVGNVNKNNMPGGTVSVSQATNMLPQPQIVTSQANSAPMQIGGPMQPMQIISQMQGSQMGQSLGFLPPNFYQFATSGGIGGQQGPIIIRQHGQPDGMFFQAAPQPTITAQAAPPQPVPTLTTAIKPRAETPSKAGGTRPLSTILPSSSGTSTTPTPIRPASSMSNQTFTSGTATGAQTGNPRPAVYQESWTTSTKSAATSGTDSCTSSTNPFTACTAAAATTTTTATAASTTTTAATTKSVACCLSATHCSTVPDAKFLPDSAISTTAPATDPHVTSSFSTSDPTNAGCKSTCTISATPTTTAAATTTTTAAAATTTTAATSTTSAATSIPNEQRNHHYAECPSAATTKYDVSCSNAYPTANAKCCTYDPAGDPATISATARIDADTSLHFICILRPDYHHHNNYACAMAPHPHQVNMTSNEKTDQQHPQILTIPVGSAVYPMNMTGTHNIRSATPMNNFQTMNGDLGQNHPGQLNIHMPMSSSQSTTCFITNPAVTSASRMSAPLGGGLITVGPAAPLSAMASMTHAVPPSSSPITISTQGPRMAMPPLQPVTVTVSASPAPQFPLPSPARQPSTPLLSTAEKVEEPKQSPRTPAEPISVPSAPTPTSSVEDVPAKKEASQLNGQQNENHITNHSPALREKKEPNLPQAVVRPQILTHVLGDFVIQESSEPFPVGRFHPNEALTRCNGHRNHENYNFKLDGEPPKKKLHVEQPTENHQSPPSAPQPPATTVANEVQQMSTPKGATMATCEGCGKMDFVAKSRRSKRFCSTACAKKPAINAPPAVVTVQSQYQQQQQETVSTTTTANGQGAKAAGGGGLLTTATSTTHSPVASITIDINKLAPPSAATVPPCTTPTTNFAPAGDKEDSSLDAELLALAAQQTRSPTTSLPQTPTQQPKPECKTNPAKWSVTEVADFVRSLTGCTDYAEDFAMQEIDGQALMLLKADHLMSAMSMKLGPALKICAKIDAMRGASSTEGGNQSNGN
ncbi:hypothetical protein GHT06_014253 [Daphnia sinensis]|uniref:Uncharacterized protein n=1 Tax=Daphnia sinensis TaxID=1820382 RepID=A0AAD5KTB0_9CRUS|nr:hypothetical protein GHT06_014253 [Daphnia sinensis]